MHALELDAFVHGLGASVDRTRLAHEVQQAEIRTAVEHGRASFLSAMTHNLRTPLATIKAALGAVLHPGPASRATDASELVATAYQESDRLERLVSKVLALSRIRAGALVAILEPVDIAESAQVAVQRVGLLANDREIALDVPSGLPLVSADPALLDVVLVNLLENALRYAPDGFVTIRARLGVEAVLIEVEDEGPGIPRHERQHVFEEFVRLDPSSGTARTGIGLAIAKAFVEAQGGRIAIADSSRGTLVCMQLHPARTSAIT